MNFAAAATVIPATAGIQGNRTDVSPALDSRFRGGDDGCEANPFFAVRHLVRRLSPRSRVQQQRVNRGEFGRAVPIARQFAQLGAAYG